jgi:uncharacterized protein YcfL
MEDDISLQCEIIKPNNMMKTYFLAIVTGLMMVGCTTPKVVEQHHHHYESIDTQAVEARVDKKMNAWRNEMDSTFKVFTNQYSASWSANESEQETITETVTSWIDSLGREVRQEQRVTNRDISRQQQQTEERITREVEQRLMSVVDSLDGVWSQRYDSIAAHQTSDIDHQTSSTPVVGDNRPLSQRVGSALLWMLVGVVAYLAVRWIGKIRKPLI